MKLSPLNPLNKTKRELQWLCDEKYGGIETAAFFRDVHRLANGEPVNYVIGFSKFLGCRIDLSKRPFIPRPETEFWVKQAIEDIQQHSNILQNVGMLLRYPQQDEKSILCLDLFAGSGCVGVAVLKHVPDARVDFAEKEEVFVEQIKSNLDINFGGPDPRRSRIVRSDVFSNIRDQYDYIFANPPYIAELRKKQVQKSVINWEPHGALFGGADGLFYLKKIISKAPRHLAPHGKMYFEFDAPQKTAIERIAAASGYQKSSFFKDQHGLWRYAVCE